MNKHNGHSIIALLVALLTLTAPAFAGSPVIWSGSHAKVLTQKGLVTSAGGPLDFQGPTNYVGNPSASLTTKGWTASGTMTRTRVTTGLPRDTTGTGLSLAAGSAGDYVQTCFDIDSVDTSKKLGFNWAQKPSSYADGDMKAEAYSFTAADCGGTATALQIDQASSGNTYYSIPNASDVIPLSFDTTTATHYGVRFTRVTGTSTLVVSDVTVTPDKSTVAGAAVGSWLTYTPTVSNLGTGSTAQNAGQYRQVGDTMEIQITFRKDGSGGSGSSEITWSIPSGYTIDSTKLPYGAFDSGLNTVGWAGLYTTSFERALDVYPKSSTTLVVAKVGGSTGYTGADISASNIIAIHAIVPIAEWAGSSSVNVGQNQPECASSDSGTWDATTTSANTVYGDNGSPISGALSAGRNKVVKFLTPIQVNDKFVLQYRDAGTSVWVNQADSAWPNTTAASVGFGGYIYQAGTTSNSITVVFNRYAIAGTTYNSTTGATDYNSAVYDRWRVCKGVAIQTSGFAAATSTSMGLYKAGSVPGYTAGSAIAAGYVGEVVSGSAIADNTSLSNGSNTTVSSITLTAGVWEIYYELTVEVASGATATNQTAVTAKITDSTVSTEIGTSLRGLLAYAATSATMVEQGMLRATETVTPSTTTTYKLAASRTDISGTGSAHYYNSDSNFGKSVFKAIRIQ